MMGSLRSRAAMVGALMLGLSASGGIAKPMDSEPMTLRHRFTRAYGHNPMTYGIKGAGISMAQQKRASRKARNVKRNRARC